MITCPKCGSDNIVVSAVAEQKRRGCLSTFLQFILAIVTLGISLIVMWIRGRKTVEKSIAVCQSCGNKWAIDGG